jgi:cytidylate kinase
MTLVALSASYGAAGSLIGPALAERLSVPFLDRAIPMAVAAELELPNQDALAYDEHLRAGWLERLLRSFVAADTGAPAPVAPETFSIDEFRRATDEVILNQATAGAGVILGRAAAALLIDDPRVLRVRLDGPSERRVHQAMQLGGVDEGAARHALRKLDRTHAAYLKHFYNVELDDPGLFHLRVDSTAIPIDGCVELIATAAKSLA